MTKWKGTLLTRLHITRIANNQVSISCSDPPKYPNSYKHRTFGGVIGIGAAYKENTNGEWEIVYGSPGPTFNELLKVQGVCGPIFAVSANFMVLSYDPDIGIDSVASGIAEILKDPLNNGNEIMIMIVRDWDIEPWNPIEAIAHYFEQDESGIMGFMLAQSLYELFSSGSQTDKVKGLARILNLVKD